MGLYENWKNRPSPPVESLPETDPPPTPCGRFRCAHARGGRCFFAGRDQGIIVELITCPMIDPGAGDACPIHGHAGKWKTNDGRVYCRRCGYPLTPNH